MMALIGALCDKKSSSFSDTSKVMTMMIINANANKKVFRYLERMYLSRILKETVELREG